MFQLARGRWRCHGNNTGSSTDTDESGSTPRARRPSVECYACTRPGVPAFHSTTCGRANSPEYRAAAGSSLVPIRSHATLPGPLPVKSATSPWVFGGVLDPRSRQVHRWNRAFLLSRAVSLAIDPLFFYALSIGRGGAPCLRVDGGFAAAVTALRTCADVVHLLQMWVQLRLAYVSRESLVVGCGKLVWDARTVAMRYVASPWRFWFDVFVVLPFPQMVFWLIIPRLVQEAKIKLITTILLLVFLFQFLPKVYHSLCVMRRMQKVTGYIFGTIWWGFCLNLIAYFIASHVAGGCWYVLAIQRIASCLQQQCQKQNNCDLISLACSKGICYRSFHVPSNCGGNNTTAAVDLGKQSIPICFGRSGSFQFGIYQWAPPIVSSDSLVVKVLFPICWGLMTLSTFGNILIPTSNWLEVMFSIITVLSGLMLFTLLIGNIQVFLHAVMARKRNMQLRCRDMEWWMRRRQLPSRLRQRVRQYERHQWTTTRGEDEMEMIRDLPDGLRRDIKRHLCLNLIKKVPWFQHLNDLILDNICDRVKPLVFSQGEMVIREGDPVQRMVFIVRGLLESRQHLSRGTVSSCTLGPGNFFGDELLSWCLRRPFVDRLPASSSSFSCINATEAFALDASDLRYITDHFRYKFANEKLKKIARYYSHNWRTWAAVNIQLAWRRYKERTHGAVDSLLEEMHDGQRRLRRYAAVFMSFRPQDHLD